MSIFRFIRWVDQGLPVKVFGDGQQRRDFTFVEDIARGTVAGLTKVGYEIPINRHFYVYEPPRPLEEIKQDVRGLEKDILDMLKKVTV